MRLIDADELLQRIQHEELQMAIHGREFSTCFNSPGGTPSTEWWYVEDLIENASTITPERKQGRWLKAGTHHGEQIFTCSECEIDEMVPTVTDFSTGISEPLWDYCPNCGADLKEGEADG